MTNILDILALSKLPPEVPDDVQRAAVAMLASSGKNPLIAGVAGARIGKDGVIASKSRDTEISKLPNVDGLTHATTMATLMLVKERLNRVEGEIAELNALVSPVLDMSAEPTPASKAEERLQKTKKRSNTSALFGKPGNSKGS